MITLTSILLGNLKSPKNISFFIFLGKLTDLSKLFSCYTGYKFNTGGEIMALIHILKELGLKEDDFSPEERILLPKPSHSDLIYSFQSPKEARFLLHNLFSHLSQGKIKVTLRQKVASSSLTQVFLLTNSEQIGDTTYSLNDGQLEFDTNFSFREDGLFESNSPYGKIILLEEKLIFFFSQPLSPYSQTDEIIEFRVEEYRKSSFAPLIMPKLMEILTLSEEDFNDYASDGIFYKLPTHLHVIRSTEELEHLLTKLASINLTNIDEMVLAYKNSLAQKETAVHHIKSIEKEGNFLVLNQGDVQLEFGLPSFYQGQIIRENNMLILGYKRLLRNGASESAEFTIQLKSQMN